MKKFIFYKLINGKKYTVFEVFSTRTKEEVRADYKRLAAMGSRSDFDGIDSVNC